MSKLRELGEVEVVRRLIAARGAGTGVLIGPGDDAAVLAPSPGAELVVTTDAFVEGRHFLPEWSPPWAAGTRLAAANLSDLAAMAALPRWALLSIGARPDRDVEALVEFQGGVNSALQPAAIVGGNLTAVEGVEWYSLTLLGEVDKGRAWTRSGAQPGDLVAITGRPGRARAGLEVAQRAGTGAQMEVWRPLLDAWLAPQSRWRFARDVWPADVVHAAIDTSDGLAGDLARLCEASGVGVVLDAAALPEDHELSRAASLLGIDEERLQLGPSDDYELILAVDPAGAAEVEKIAERGQVPVSFVGRFTDALGTLEIVDGSGAKRPLRERGYDPFAGSAI